MDRKRNKLLRNKHRIVVEVTFKDMIIEKEAIKRMNFIIGDKNSAWRLLMVSYLCKGWTRVFPVHFRKAVLKRRIT